MSNIKEHFVSRWGSKGVLVEADWSSLELMGWAFLTQDSQVLKLIKEGQDLHRFVGSKVLKCNPEDIDAKTRSDLKSRNFHLVYGGWWKKLSRDYGMTEYDAEQLYNTFWNLFPMAKQVQEGWVKEVETNSYYINKTTKSGAKMREGYYTAITGRKMYFQTYDYHEKSRDYGKKTRFQAPEIFNNKIQSFCTADIHMIALGNLFRKALPYRDKMLLINTVHDSVMADIKLVNLIECAILIKQSMEEVDQILKDRFGIILNVPFVVEIKAGPSWSDMKELELNNEEI